MDSVKKRHFKRHTIPSAATSPAGPPCIMGPQPCVKRNKWKKTHNKERKRRYDKQKIEILYSNANGL